MLNLAPKCNEIIVDKDLEVIEKSPTGSKKEVCIAGYESLDKFLVMGLNWLRVYVFDESKWW